MILTPCNVNRKYFEVTYSVDDDCSEDGAGNSLAILGLWVVDAPDELFMATAVEASDSAQNNDREDRDDRAVEMPCQLPSTVEGR